jgi:hypothetical protein
VVVGDFNGNGTSDLAGLWVTNPSDQWWVASTAASGSGATATNAMWTQWGNVPWTNVMAADINGDGKSDIIGRVASGQFAGQWYVAISNGTGFTTSLLDTWDTSISWNDVVVGDFNGDGKMDIAARTGSGSWYFSYSTGTSLVHANSPITTLALNYVFSGVGKVDAALFHGTV